MKLNARIWPVSMCGIATLVFSCMSLQARADALLPQIIHLASVANQTTPQAHTNIHNTVQVAHAADSRRLR